MVAGTFNLAIIRSILVILTSLIRLKIYKDGLRTPVKKYTIVSTGIVDTISPAKRVLTYCIAVLDGWKTSSPV